MSQGAHVNESWCTCEWVMVHISRSHGTIRSLKHCSTTPWYVHHDSFTCAPLHAMTHFYVCHDSFTCGRQDSLICASWLIHLRALTHSYVHHDSFMCTPHMWPPRLVDMCAMTHSHVRHDSIICAPWLNLREKWRKCFSVTGKLRGQAQVRPIDKLDEACTNADDRMMLVQHRSGDRVMRYRGFGQISWANSVRRLISSSRQEGGRQTKSLHDARARLKISSQ